MSGQIFRTTEGQARNGKVAQCQVTLKECQVTLKVGFPLDAAT